MNDTTAIIVIGINPDTVLNPRQIEALTQSEAIYTSPRHRTLINTWQPGLHGNWQMWLSPIEKSLHNIKKEYNAGKKLVVIASGDPMCYGIGATLNRYFPELKLCVLPAPSSFCLASARLCWSHEDTIRVSLHHYADKNVLGYLPQHKNILCLTKNQDSPRNIAQILNQHGWGQSIMTILEELGGSNERIREYPAQDMLSEKLEFQKLNIVGIQPVSQTRQQQKPGFFTEDHTLVHDGQLTKFAFRAVTLATLNPSPQARLWDIGAGSGAISLGWIALGGHAIAVEQNASRCQNIRQNTEKYTSLIFQLLEENADDILDTLHKNNPAPEAIFFGGALHLIEKAMPMLSKNGVLVANAVTLASQNHLMQLRLKYGGTIRRISIEEEDSIAHLPALKPARAVIQYRWSHS